MCVRTTVALALLVALAGCSTAPTNPDDAANHRGHSIEAPTAIAALVEPTTALLDWQDTGVEAGTRYVQGPEWEAVGSTSDNAQVDLGRGGDSIEIDAGPGRTISEVLMSEDWAVVVRQDRTETAPSEVVAVDLATGEQRDVVSPPAASGGSWALTGGDLYYPTYGDGGAYCLATSALADGNGEDGWCAPGKTGFSGLTASEHGVGMMTFDDARPIACRTVNLLEAGVPKALERADDCRPGTSRPPPAESCGRRFHGRAARRRRASAPSTEVPPSTSAPARPAASSPAATRSSSPATPRVRTSPLG